MLLKDDFVMQGGVRNYLGKTEEVKAPKFWQSSEDSPPTELAYITEAEKGLLIDANLHGSLKDGKPNVGASGLLSYDGFGSRDSSQNRAGGDVSSSMDRGGSDSGGSSSGGGSTSAYQNNTSTTYNTAMSKAQEQKVEAKNVVDLVNSGVNLNDALTGKTSLERITSTPTLTLNVLKEIVTPFANAANKKRRNDFMSTADIKAYELGTGLNWNPNGVIVENSAEFNYLKNEKNYFDTLSSSNNNTTVGSGNDNVTLFDNSQDFKTIETNENSMVNDFFKNIGSSNLGVSSAYMDTYNKAKDQVAKSLNLTPNTQQFGYEANPYSNYSMSMTSANPFFDELDNQGLI